MIQFGCPHCGGHFEIDESEAGQETNCPSCGGALIVPGLEDFGPPPPPDYGPPPPPDYGPPPPPDYGPPPPPDFTSPPGYGEFGGYDAPPGPAYAPYAAPPADYAAPPPVAQHYEAAWQPPGYDPLEPPTPTAYGYAEPPPAQGYDDLVPAEPEYTQPYDTQPSPVPPETAQHYEAPAETAPAHAAPDNFEPPSLEAPPAAIPKGRFSADPRLADVAPAVAWLPPPAEDAAPVAQLAPVAAAAQSGAAAFEPQTSFYEEQQPFTAPLAEAPRDTAAELSAAAAKNMPVKAPEDPLAVREPETKKIVTSKGQVKELRLLTPEEKAARRFRRNLLLVTFGIIILSVVVAVLNHFGVSGKP